MLGELANHYVVIDVIVIIAYVKKLPKATHHRTMQW